MKEYEDLEKRVMQFNTLSLPGQPFGMHMGTSYLVFDLWQAVMELSDKIKTLEAATGEGEKG